VVYASLCTLVYLPVCIYLPVYPGMPPCVCSMPPCVSWYASLCVTPPCVPWYASLCSLPVSLLVSNAAPCSFPFHCWSVMPAIGPRVVYSHHPFHCWRTLPASVLMSLLSERWPPMGPGPCVDHPVSLLVDTS